MAKTIRLTVAQALVKFLNNQYIEFDGKETPMFAGIFGIFGVLLIVKRIFFTQQFCAPQETIIGFQKWRQRTNCMATLLYSFTGKQ